MPAESRWLSKSHGNRLRSKCWSLTKCWAYFFHFFESYNTWYSNYCLESRLSLLIFRSYGDSSQDWIDSCDTDRKLTACCLTHFSVKVHNIKKNLKLCVFQIIYVCLLSNLATMLLIFQKIGDLKLITRLSLRFNLFKCTFHVYYIFQFCSKGYKGHKGAFMFLNSFCLYFAMAWEQQIPTPAMNGLSSRMILKSWLRSCLLRSYYEYRIVCINLPLSFFP